MGTNSVKLTVGGPGEDGRMRVLHDRTKITRLGKNVDAAGRLDPEAVRRTLDALAEFAEEARNLGARRIAAVGTSALRDAADGAQFVAEAEKALGGTVEVITGEREADLIYAAVLRDPDLNLRARFIDAEDATLIAMDIGGGSTEIVIGQGETVLFRDSVQMGAVRLTERALPSDPPTASEIERAIGIADEAVARIPAPTDFVDNPLIMVVGSGGTISNLAAMEKRQPDFRPDALHGMTLSRSQIEERIEMLAKRTVAERREIPGLEPDRADVILAGAILQARALYRFNASSVTVSTRGLRYGLLYELLDADDEE